MLYHAKPWNAIVLNKANVENLLNTRELTVLVGVKVVSPRKQLFNCFVNIDVVLRRQTFGYITLATKFIVILNPTNDDVVLNSIDHRFWDYGDKGQ